MLLTLILTESGEVDILFLKNEDIRGPTTNYFFTCNVKNSQTLVWEIDGVGISEFEHLEDVITGTLSNKSYYASLISMRNSSEHFILDSVLIVTAPDGSTVNVTCVSNRHYKTISNQVDPRNTENHKPIRNASVNLLPVFLTNSTIETDSHNISTKAFTCATNSRDLLWEINTSNTTEYIAFNSSSDIGTSDSRLTNEGDTVRLQAISLGQHHRHFYYILYVTDNTFKGVRCLAGGRAVKYMAHKPIIVTPDEGW